MYANENIYLWGHKEHTHMNESSIYRTWLLLFMTEYTLLGDIICYMTINLHNWLNVITLSISATRSLQIMFKTLRDGYKRLNLLCQAVQVQWRVWATARYSVSLSRSFVMCSDAESRAFECWAEDWLEVDLKLSVSGSDELNRWCSVT